CCDTLAWALWLLGESTARQASPEGEPAAGHYRQALALGEELGMGPLGAHCPPGLGPLCGSVASFHLGRIWGMISRRDDPGQREGERQWRSASRGPISHPISFSWACAEIG